MTPTTVTLAQAAQLLKERDNFLLLTHDRPDGDAIGALAGLLDTLRANGKQAVAWIPEAPPERYRGFLPGEGLRIGEPVPDLAAFSTVVCLDFSQPDRCPSIRLEHPAILNLDHHPDNARFGRWNLVAPEACATTEILHWLIGAVGWELSAEAATALLLGVIMDTGGFRFDNTASGALGTAADLTEAGADYRRVVAGMFFAKPMNLVRLEADLALNHLHAEADGRFAWAWLDPALFAAHGVAENETEGLIEVLRGIAGTVVVALFQPRDGNIRVSLRSKDPRIPVGPIARAFAGGGHEMAAGATLVGMDREQAIAAIRERVLAALAAD
jgi:phosphoesterase RecJ-like protein